MEIEIGKEYKTKTNENGKRTPGGTFKVTGIKDGQIKFKVLDEHRESAGGIFTIDTEKFKDLIDTENSNKN